MNEIQKSRRLIPSSSNHEPVLTRNGGAAPFQRKTTGGALLALMLLMSIARGAAAEFTSIDLGNPPPKAGQTVEVAPMQTYTVTGYGQSFGAYAASDQGRFVYVKLTGDFDVSLRIASVKMNTAVPEFQLMVRKSLDPKDLFFAAGIVYHKPKTEWASRLQVRTVYGKSQSDGRPSWNSTWAKFPTGATGPFPDYWVRIKRVGNVFHGYFRSGRQTAWTESLQPPDWPEAMTMDLGQTVYVGMAVSNDVDREKKQDEGVTVTFTDLTGFGSGR